MKCPLLKTSLTEDGKIFPLVPADCLKEECAWWEAVTGRCAILHAAEQLQKIVGGLMSLTTLINERRRK